MIPLLAAALLGQAPVVVPDAPKGLKLRLERRPLDEWTRTHPTTSVLYALTFTNDTKQAVELVQTGFWSNHKVVLTNAAGDEPPFSKVGKQRRDWVIDVRTSGVRDRQWDRVLKPSESWTDETSFDVSSLYDIAPGDYNLTVEYFEQHWYPMRLVSNRLPFEKRADLPPSSSSTKPLERRR